MLQQEYRNNNYTKYCNIIMLLSVEAHNKLLMQNYHKHHIDVATVPKAYDNLQSLRKKRDSCRGRVVRDIKTRDQEGVILKCCNIMVATIAIPIVVAMKKAKAMQVSRGMTVNVVSCMDLSSTSLINAAMRNISLTCIWSGRNAKTHRLTLSTCM